MKKVEKIVIPVAGVGTRLLPVTKSQPKEMLPVGRKPVVQYVVEEAEEAGIRQILFVTGRQKHSIEDHFDHDPDLARRLAEVVNFFEPMSFSDVWRRLFPRRRPKTHYMKYFADGWVAGDRHPPRKDKELLRHRRMFEKSPSPGRSRKT